MRKKFLTEKEVGMTTVQNAGRLQIIFSISEDKTHTETIANIRPTALDQDLYDIAVAIANLISDPLISVRLTSVKEFGE